MIFAIGKGDLMVARSHVCDFPDEAYDLVEITSFPSLDLPSIVSYQPDLVLASTEIHNELIVSSFNSLNVPLYFQSYNTLEDIYRNIRTLGKMLHASEAADHLADSLARLAQVIADSNRNEIGYRTAILMGMDPITVVGGKSFINDMLEKSGGKNVFASLGEKYPTVTVEELAKAQPEFLILPTRNDQLYQQLLARYPDLHTLVPAALNDHVFMVDPGVVVRPGPRVIEGMVTLTRVLHPRVDLVNLLD
jgi:iron complex transport system substrate-binding protein